MAVFTFKSDDDVKAYLDYLIANRLTYHFDDSLIDVFWREADVSQADLTDLIISNYLLQEYCNIWKWFDAHEDYYSKYTNA